MPWPVNYSHREGCNYCMCTNDGHSVCDAFGQYYERLCALAQAVVLDPSPENLQVLQAALDEERGAVRG